MPQSCLPRRSAVLVATLTGSCLWMGASGAPARGQQFEALRTAGHATVVFSDGSAIEAVRGLAPGAKVAIDRFPLPEGRTADLELERFTVTTPETRFVIGTPGGPDRPLNFDANQIVMLRGNVRGMPGSHVFLSFSPWGSSGTITTGPGEQPIAVTSRSGGGVDLVEGELAVYEVPASGPAGAGSIGLPLTCGTDTSRCEPQLAAARRLRPITPGLGARPMADGANIKGLQQVQIAVETDYEFFSLYGNLQAAGAYVTQLYAQVSDIYIRDVNTRVDLAYVRLWDTPSGLYPGEEPLAVFRDYWNANMGSVARDVAQYCSGRRNLNAGGVAYLGGLCNNNSYSWIGYVAGFFADPSIPHVHNHDIMVAAHELGHNCNTPHTHDLGLDTCDDGTSQPQRGTIMSYCGQTFTGGAANQDLRMHAVVELIMEEYINARACVADDCNQNGIHDPLDLASGFSQDTNGNGTPDECEDCNANGVLDPQDIASGFSEDENANGTPDECEPDCNSNNLPDDLDFIGRIVDPTFADNFEQDLGWTTEVLGATDGPWERAIPVNDPGWEYDPQSDSDGSGRCFVTDNAAGNSDVDNGAVRLTSPVISMAGGGKSLSYDYFLRLTNSNGVDRLLVEGNNAGGAGTWVVLATHTSDNGLAWTRSVLTPAQFAAAGLAQTSTMRLRFTANDGGTQSIVESGVDAVVIGTYVPPVSTDLNFNNIPDECEPDDDNNNQLDYAQIQADMSLDLNRNARLDAYEDCDGDSTPDITELNQSHNVWIASLDHTRAREYLALWGTLTRQSADAALAQAIDLIITPDRRILVTSATDSRVVEFAASGALVGNLLPSGSGGLANPAGMLIRPGGRLLVASRGTNSVLRVRPRHRRVHRAVRRVRLGRAGGPLRAGVGNRRRPVCLERRRARPPVQQPDGRFHWRVCDARGQRRPAEPARRALCALHRPLPGRELRHRSGPGVQRHDRRLHRPVQQERHRDRDDPGRAHVRADRAGGQRLREPDARPGIGPRAGAAPPHQRADLRVPQGQRVHDAGVHPGRELGHSEPHGVRLHARRGRRRLQQQPAAGQLRHRGRLLARCQRQRRARRVRGGLLPRLQCERHAHDRGFRVLPVEVRRWLPVKV